jgi:uncharacterized SAM-binding protein YcdF (DUF218 family)
MIFAGSFLIIDDLVVSSYSNFTIGCIITLIFSAILLIWGICYKRIHTLTKKGLPRIIRVAVACGMGLTVALCAFFVIYGSTDTVTYNEDAVIVLGCGVKGTVPTQPLAARLDKAAEYAGKNPDALIVVSGGQGFQEDISEAQCMYDYLTERGVDGARIITESESTSTSENMIYSKRLLDERLGSYSAAVITNDFHIFRAKRLAGINGLNVTSMHAPTPWYTISIMCLREILAAGQLAVLRQ